MQRVLTSFARIVGPAAVMAAGTMGAGATSSLILSGAWFRYDLIWVAVAVLPLFVYAVDSASRIGLVNRETGMFSLIRERIHPGIAWLILAINIPVHLFIAMGQMSVMTASVLSVFDQFATGAGGEPGSRRAVELLLSIAIAAAVVWMLTSEGYQRMQKLMTAIMLAMFVCFLLVALRGFQEIGAILLGLVPKVPPDLSASSGAVVRESEISIVAIIGSVLAPAALLGIPYMSADNRGSEVNFKAEFRKSLINLGYIYGGYSLLVIIAGGFALYPLANHGEIDSVHEAGQVLVRAFPEGLAFLGPIVFSLGLFMAALTTYIVVVEVISYFCLDMFRYPWHYSKSNTRFKRLTVICILVPAVLAPFWTFPALFKVLLLMGVNTIVIPLVFLVVIILVNRRDVMGEHTAGLTRNVFLAAGLLVSTALSIMKLPDFVRLFGG
jgi:Mn2+/Fe2+ NRAMP family transporter